MLALFVYVVLFVNLIGLCNGIVTGMLWLLLTDQDVLLKSQIFKSKEGAGLLLWNKSFACS